MSVGRSCAGTRRNSRGSIGFGGIRWFREQGENHDRESVGSHIFVVWGGTHRRRRRGRRALAVILDRGTCEGRKIVAMRQIRRRVPLDSRRVARPRSGCGQTGLLSIADGVVVFRRLGRTRSCSLLRLLGQFHHPELLRLTRPNHRALAHDGRRDRRHGDRVEDDVARCSRSLVARARVLVSPAMSGRREVRG